MNILVAFDKIPGALGAFEACSLAEEVLLKLHPNWHIHTAAWTGGGTDFCRSLTRAYFGRVEPQAVLGASLMPVEAEIGWVECARLPEAVRSTLGLRAAGQVAIIEAASALGAGKVDGSDTALGRSSYGLGQLIGRAADAGAEAILLGLGDAATLDLGLGALQAVGLEVIGEASGLIPRLVPSMWAEVVRLRGELWPHIPPVIAVADGTFPLLGPNGAVMKSGPEKGLKPGQLVETERLAGKIAKLLGDFFEQPRNRLAERYAGQGGGLGLGLAVGLDARIHEAAEIVPAWLGLDGTVAACDVVLTGGGRLDAATLHNGGIAAVLRAASRHGKHTFVIGTTKEAGLRLPQKVSFEPVSPVGLSRERARSECVKLLAARLKAIFAR